IAAIASSGMEIPIAPSTISFWCSRFSLQRLLTLVGAFAQPLLDPLDERVDEGRLEVGAELFARLDRCMQLVLANDLVHTPILPRRVPQFHVDDPGRRFPRHGRTCDARLAGAERSHGTHP